MKFQDSLPLLAHFQNGCPDENAEHQKYKFLYLNLQLSQIYTIYL